MFVVESVDGQYSLKLPALTECDNIPDIKNEIPTEACALNHKHLEEIAPYIKEDRKAETAIIGS